jgi:hypothetical protein
LFAQYDSRRDASLRSLRLPCRSCVNCWPCDCGGEPPADRWVDAGAAAARHLLNIGCTPILQQHVLCALWCRGGGDRALAQNLYDVATVTYER